MPGLIVEHAFASPKAQGVDATVVGPNQWNAPLKLTLAGAFKALFDMVGSPDRMLVFTGAETAEMFATTAYMRGLLSSASASALLGSLGAAALASPAFSGVPTAPTAALGTNTLQLANTAFVQAAIAALVASSPAALDTLNELAAALGNDANFATTITNALALKAPLASPALTGTPTAPTVGGTTDSTTTIATTAFVQAVAALKASLVSPALTGTPTAPTPSLNDNSTKIATTAYVDGSISASAAPTTGDAKLTFKTVADSGWIMANDGSIGNASSGGTTRANADTSALFTLLYTNITSLTVQDSSGSTVGRGASAAADFAANRRLVIPKTLGRSIAIAGSGSGLTSRTLGTTAGAETETPTIAKTAAHTHAPGVGTLFWASTPGGGSTDLAPAAGQGSQYAQPTVTASTGSGSALNVVDPSTYLNIMIKL